MFSKKPEQAQRASLPAKQSSRGMAGNSTFSVIGSDVTITGNVSASTELHVDGHIEGDITCASLVQGESSVLQGAVQAETARMAGTLTGSITARELVILKTAKIHGDVHYDALTIEQGAVVEGKFAPQSSASASSNGLAGGTSPSDDELTLTLAN